MKNEIKNPMERFISKEEIYLFGDGGVSECDDCCDSETTTPGHTGRFICSHCGGEFDVSEQNYVDPENTVCNACYAKINNRFICCKCGYSCPCAYESSIEEVCINCYNELPNCPICGKKVIDYDRFTNGYDYCNTCGNAITVTVTPSSATVDKDESITLTATVSHGQDLPVTWSTEDTDIVSVSDDGTVTGISAGTATVTASIPLGASDSADITVTDHYFTCKECERTCPCSKRAYETEYCYECYSKFPICPNCLKTVIPEDRLCEESNLCKECGEKLTVYIHPENAKVTVGKAVQLTAFVSDNYDLPITWSTEDTDKISLSDDGTITGLSAGTATVTATIPGGASATVTVEVVAMDIPHFEYSGANADTSTLDWVGTFSVDTYTGALSMELGEISVDGSLLPVSIKHQYHSNFANRKYTKADNELVADFSGMKLGDGWRLNIMQGVVPTEDSNVYAYINEDGECILLTYAEEVRDENNNLKYAAGYRNDDYEICYKADSRIMTIGSELTYLFTSTGWLESIIDVSKQTDIGLSIVYKNGKIDYVVDGAEREYKFEYNDDNLKSITAPDGLISEYFYTDGYLTGILRGGDKAAVIEYNTDGTICSVTASPWEEDSHSFYIDYLDGRVNGIIEEYNSNSIGSTLYEYDTEKNSTLITRGTADDDENDELKYVYAYTKYTFDSDGNVVSSFNHSDDVRYSPEVDATPPDGNTFGIVKTANLIYNGSFENSSENWTADMENCTGDVDDVAGNQKFGNQCYKISSNSANAFGALKQVVSLPVGDYTLSAYMKSENAADNYMAYLRVTGTGLDMESETLTYADGNYVRLEVQFSITASMAVELSVKTQGIGNTYIDGVMLEKAPCATEFNLIDNAGFEDGTAAWTVNGDVDVISDDQFSGSASLRFAGGSSFAEISQNVGVNSDDGTRETYTLSAWAKTGYSIADANKSENAPKCYIGAIMTYTDKNSAEKTEEFITEFAPGVYDWQNAAVYIEKPELGSVTGLTVFARCENITSDVFFDSISLVRDSIETELAEEDFPDLDNGDNSETTDTGFTENQDDVGNNLTETTFADDTSLGAIYRSFTYTDDKNNLKTVRDERGYVTVYDVEKNSSRVLSETDPLGNKKEYAYDVYGRTKKVTHKDSFGTAIASVEYEYDAFDNLTSIDRGDRNYRLEYNYMHQLDSIKADNLTDPLVRYDYTHGGRPKKVTYANGDVMTAVYNAKGQIISEKWTRGDELTAHYKYVYDMSDNLIRSIDIIGRKEYNYVYEDGVIVRSTECDITVNGETVGARTPVNTVLYTYNGSSLVKKRIIPENGFDTEQVYTYPKDNGNTASCTFVRGDTTVTATSVTDGLGRAVSESIATASGTISRSFTYTDGDSEPVDPPLDTNEYKPTTQLVSKIELSDGTVLDYVYDACGRIKTVTETRNGTSTVTEYTYDSLGQLVSETVNDTVVNCIRYDSYGNILEKNGVAYSYDSTWKDRLTSVGNQAITYGSDPCNPATYFGNTLVWEKGRQLKKFGENISYKYNANGIRTRKTVNDRNHFYFLDGTRILREIWGTDALVPIYDTNESVIGLTHSTESGTSTYYFLKNLQGDIIALTDEAGAVVARYKYDAWGKVLAVTDANGNSITSPFDIANVNPFRYRGYYYDTETGLYYLQSRYYDPEVGRFINADEAIFLSGYVHCVGLNAACYCINSPISKFDPNGKWVLSVGIEGQAAFALGVYAGFAVNLDGKWNVSITCAVGIAIITNVSAYIQGYLAYYIGKKDVSQLNGWGISVGASISAGVNLSVGGTFDVGFDGSTGGNINIGYGVGVSVAPVPYFQTRIGYVATLYKFNLLNVLSNWANNVRKSICFLSLNVTITKKADCVEVYIKPLKAIIVIYKGGRIKVK